MMTSVDEVLTEFIDYDAEDDLERVVEGNNSGSEHGSDDDADPRSDEAEEEQPKKPPEVVETKKRVVKPRITLNPARLMGPRGLEVIKDHFKDFKFKGKGHEKEDLDHIMKLLEHWAHRLYPKYKFDDCLDKIAHLGKKKLVSIHMRKIHLGMLMSDVPLNEVDSDEETAVRANPAGVGEKDDFDLLLEQQIALARSTPASANKFQHGHTTPGSTADTWLALTSINEDFAAPSTSADITTPKPPTLTEEQRQKILKNKQLAEERRKARLADVIVDITTENDRNLENVLNRNTVDLTERDVDIGDKEVVCIENDMILVDE